MFACVLLFPWFVPHFFILRARATLPLWGTVKKKIAPDKVYLSHVCTTPYILVYDDYQIIISRWHSRSSAWLGSISNASTT